MPALDAQFLAQAFDVSDQVRETIVAEFSNRAGTPTPALIE